MNMQSAVRRFAITLICLISLMLPVCGQHNIDSLLLELKVSSGRQAMDINLQLCFAYAEIDDEPKNLRHAKLAFSIAKELKDSLGIIKAGRIVGRGYKIFNKIDSAIYILKYALSFAKENYFTFEYGQLLNTLGVTYIYKASYVEALKCNLESLSVMEKLDNKQWVSISLHNIGYAYYKLEDYVKALEYYNRSYNLKRVINYNSDVDLLLVNIALCYAYMDKYQAANKYIKLAMEVCGLDCTDNIKTQAEYASGVVAFRQNNIAESESHFLRSHSLAYKIDNKRLLFDNVIMLSQVYQKSNKLVKSEKYLLMAEVASAGTSYGLERIKLFEQFFLLYKMAGDLKKMAHYQSKYIYLKDSIYNEDYTNGLMRVQAEFLKRENNARLAIQQQNLELKDKIIVRQNWLNILAGVTAMLLFLVVYFLYRRNKQRRIANRLLGQKIAARTSELESSYSELRKRLEENELTHKKTIADARSIVATMKGLSSGSIDSESLKQMEMLEIALDHLVETLKNVSEPQRNYF